MHVCLNTLTLFLFVKDFSFILSYATVKMLIRAEQIRCRNDCITLMACYVCGNLLASLESRSAGLVVLWGHSFLKCPEISSGSSWILIHLPSLQMAIAGFSFRHSFLQAIGLDSLKSFPLNLFPKSPPLLKLNLFLFSRSLNYVTVIYVVS